jgi:hypothetical protein
MPRAIELGLEVMEKRAEELAIQKNLNSKMNLLKSWQARRICKYCGLKSRLWKLRLKKKS